MDVQFPPELEEKLSDLAGLSGVPTSELVRDVMARYVDRADQIRRTLDRRYDELEAGAVIPIDGEAVRREMKAKNQAVRDRRR